MQKIIDAHAHIFPEKIAEKAAVGIGEFYDLEMNYDGRLSTLLNLGQEAGVHHFIVQSVATIPAQVRSINDFIALSVTENKGLLTGLAAMHPDFDEIEDEIDRIIRLGLKGVKLHPDFQKFNIDEKKACKIYEIIEGRLPILIHTGDFRFDYSSPKRLKNVLKMFPKLTAIGAHFGGWSEWDDAAKHLEGTGVYVDTSSSLYELTPERAKEMISIFTPERVLFGTDYPMWSPTDELKLLDKVELDEQTRSKILYENSARLFSVEL